MSRSALPWRAPADRDGEWPLAGPLAPQPLREPRMVDDRALVKSLPDRFDLIPAGRPKPQPPAVDFDELDLRGDQHPDRRGHGVRHLDARPDGALDPPRDTAPARGRRP